MTLAPDSRVGRGFGYARHQHHALVAKRTIFVYHVSFPWARMSYVMQANITADDAFQLLDVIQRISLAKELEAVTDIVKRAARQLSGAEGVTFVLRDGDQCYYVDEDAISPLWKGRRFPMDICISGWAMRHRETVVIEDIYQDERIPIDAYRPTFVKSLLMIPVRSSDPVAAIGAYWANRHIASARQIDLLQSLADTTAIAIDNVQLIEALKHRAEESSRHLEQFKQEVAKREEVEEQFVQAQKMEAIGRLAGGVAHDFNNLLMVISGYSNMALERVTDDEELEEALSEISQTAERAASLTRQLLAFSRRQVVKPSTLNLNDVASRMDKMLQRVIGEQIDMVMRLQPNLDPVKCDAGQIEQVVMNLAVNARDAMPHGGKLTIETDNVYLDTEYASNHADAHPGPHVMIAVTDTGIGMSTEVRRRIFEPFYTTKELGRGTGLGLAGVYGIIKQSGGNIWVYSEPDRGTIFKIYLPRDEGSEVRTAPAHTKKSATPRGSETILLVEDDHALRRLLMTVLVKAGYNVMPAADADEAIGIVRQYQDDIHMLLTDLVLPKMDGAQLVNEIGDARPGLKVVFMSGYTDNALVHHGLVDSDAAFIEKPVSPRTLLAKVHEYLA